MATSSGGLVPGTPLIIGAAAANGAATITCTSLANGAVRQSSKTSASLLQAPPGCTNAVMPSRLTLTAACKMASGTGLAGLELDVFIGWSSSSIAGTGNPGGLLGSDTTYLLTDAEPQLQFVGAIVGSTSIGTGLQQQGAIPIDPLDQYFILVAANNMGQATDSIAGDTTFTLIPWYLVFQS